MQHRWLNAGKVLAIQLLFGTTFSLSAALKCSGGVPAWFIQQFQETGWRRRRAACLRSFIF
ncbi:hypothetical protein BH20VER3_BH20VER3_23360 [soil metagenome]